MTRSAVRPTAFGIFATLLVVVAIVVHPAVTEPSVAGLVWAGLAGAIVVGVVWPIVTVRALKVTVHAAPTDLVVGQLASLELELAGRASGVTLACTGQPLVVLDVVSPGRVRVPFTIAHRGAFGRIRLDVGSDAPFGIVSVTRSRLVELPRPVLVAPVGEPASAQAQPLPGDDAAPRPAGTGLRGDSVRSVRPYATGDPSHLVHWPSSARLGSLVVRELEPPAAEVVAIVVDLTPPEPDAAGRLAADTAGTLDADAADASVEAAAARAMGLADDALERGARVMLSTVEAHGPVTAEAGELLAARRRLALAVAGTPEPPPVDWPVRTVRALPPQQSGDGTGAAAVPPDRPPEGADSAAPGKRRRPKVSPDRRTITFGRLVLLWLLAGLQLYAAIGSLPQSSLGMAANVGLACAFLAVMWLRSIPIRWIVRGFTLLSGLVLAGFGELGALEGVTGSWQVLLWLATTAAALALAPSSRAVPGVATGTVVNAADLPGAGDRVRGKVPVVVVVAAVALVGAAALLVGPRAATLFPVGARGEDPFDLSGVRGSSPLSGSETLDMTSRPRLSNRVVMTVRSPTAMLWRTDVYDVWDGSTWYRGSPRLLPVDDGRIVPAADDLAASDGTATTQEIRIEADSATALPAPASPVQVDAGPRDLVQRIEGTVHAPAQPLARGDTYRVESRQLPLDVAALRAATGELPDEVATRYATALPTTDRVAELARSLTAGVEGGYDRIRAIEAWMSANLAYSLDAPLSDPGVDAVDQFLFEDRVGWCEQIASSLVVMARVVGVPARLVTGYASGDFDAAAGRYLVRENDAHAWVEVWFSDLGWVSVDPTAAVPLAGSAEAAAGAAARDWREIAGVALLVVGVVALAAGWFRRVGRRWGGVAAARLGRRRLLRTRWDVAEEDRIERAGAAAGRPRGPGETITAYGVVVAGLTGDEAVATTAREIERRRYGPPG